jgi:hypothetical protein
MPQYSVLTRIDAEPHAPLLVRDEPRERTSEGVPYYYIVPFGLKNEREGSESPLVRTCVLVNAYTGAFEEVTSFGRPLRYLTRTEALTVVSTAMKIHPRELNDADAVLMFQAGEITHVRTFPFWRVAVGDRIVYVDQLGTVYTKLLPSVPGD